MSVLQALRTHVAHPEAYNSSTVEEQKWLLCLYAAQAKARQEADDRILAEAVQVVAGELTTEPEIQKRLWEACAEERRMAIDAALARKLHARDVQEAADSELARELNRVL